MRGSILAALLFTACSSSPPPTVRVTLYEHGMPVAGAPAWFGDPATGEVIASGTTDGSGRFGAAVPPGASVSVANEDTTDPPSWSVYTALGTQPGDDLKLGDSQPVAQSQPLGSVSVTLPGPFAGAASYQASLGCQMMSGTDPTAPLSLPASSDCLTTGGKLALFAQALDGSGKALAFTTAIAIDPPPAGASATATVGAWRTDFATFTATLTGAPMGTASLETDLQLLDDGALFDGGSQTTPSPPAGMAVTSAFTFASDLATRLVWKQVLTYGTSAADGFQALVRSSGASPLPTADTLDPATEALPRISGVSGTIGANGSPTLSWSAAGDLSAADGLVAIASWTNQNDSRVHWLLIGPAGAASSLSFPRLADALKKASGVPGTPVSQGIRALEADYVAGYDDFRHGKGIDMLSGGPPPSMDLRARVSGDGMARF